VSLRPARLDIRHTIDHFEDDSFQAVSCISRQAILQTQDNMRHNILITKLKPSSRSSAVKELFIYECKSLYTVVVSG